MRRWLWLVGVLACRPPAVVTHPPQRLDIADALCVDDGDAVRCFGGARPGLTPLDPAAERLFFACTRAGESQMRCPLRDPPVIDLPELKRPFTPVDQRCVIDRKGGARCLSYITATWERPFAVSPVIDISGGVEFGCLLDRDGAVTCWDRGLRPVWRPLPDERGLRRLASGSSTLHGCAITDGHDVACWSTFGSHAARPEVRHIGPAVDVSFHIGTHACARLADGRVACFGPNCSGELGTGDRVSSSHARLVAGLADVEEVRVGAQAACARKRDGSLWCWGAAAAYGGVQPGPRARPEPVRGIADAVALAVAGDHACAVDQAGRVSCWGDRYQVDQDGCREWAPVELEHAGAAVDVALGDRLGCVRDRDGRVTCWEHHSRVSTAAITRPLPGQHVDLSVGSGHVCTLAAGGQVRCWNFVDHYTPWTGDAPPTRPIELPAPAVDIAVAGARACAVTEPGGVHCWTLPAFPYLRTTVEQLPIADAVEVALDDDTTCARTRAGRVVCLGDVPAPADLLATLTDARGLALAPAGVCVLAGDGAVRCVGRRDLQLGVEPDETPGATTIALDAPARGLAFGRAHACALGSDGRVRCWGAGFDVGQLGDGLTPYSTTPVQIRGPMPPRR